MAIETRSSARMSDFLDAEAPRDIGAFPAYLCTTSRISCTPIGLIEVFSVKPYIVEYIFLRRALSFLNLAHPVHYDQRLLFFLIISGPSKQAINYVVSNIRTCELLQPAAVNRRQLSPAMLLPLEEQLRKRETSSLSLSGSSEPHSLPERFAEINRQLNRAATIAQFANFQDVVKIFSCNSQESLCAPRQVELVNPGMNRKKHQYLNN